MSIINVMGAPKMATTKIHIMNLYQETATGFLLRLLDETSQ